MVWLLRKCEQCRKYTLSHEKCRYCGGKVRIPHPARFSPQDKYAKYRRALKTEPLDQTDQNERNLHQGNREA